MQFVYASACTVQTLNGYMGTNICNAPFDIRTLGFVANSIFSCSDHIKCDPHSLPNSRDQTVTLCCRLFACLFCCREYNVALFVFPACCILQYVIDGTGMLVPSCISDVWHSIFSCCQHTQEPPEAGGAGLVIGSALAVCR